MSAGSIWTAGFWQGTLERALATAAQSAIAYIPVAQFTVIGFDWVALGGLAAGGAVLSVLKALAANAITGTGPSITNAEQTIDQPAADVAEPRRAWDES